ncbi:MAG TPA: BsuPI-related putative proteinase inhibitor [Longimicrobiales bacterium]
MRGIAAVALVVLTAGCGRGDRVVVVDPGAGAPLELAASLDARVRGDSVVFTLHLSNPTSGPVRLSFTSGQRYDFMVSSLTGEVLWTWSADRSFIQSLDSLTLRAGETLNFDAAWSPSRPGEYAVTGIVTSSDKRVELRTVFEVPTR